MIVLRMFESSVADVTLDTTLKSACFTLRAKKSTLTCLVMPRVVAIRLYLLANTRSTETSGTWCHGGGLMSSTPLKKLLNISRFLQKNILHERSSFRSKKTQSFSTKSVKDLNLKRFFQVRPNRPDLFSINSLLPNFWQIGLLNQTPSLLTSEIEVPVTYLHTSTSELARLLRGACFCWRNYILRVSRRPNSRVVHETACCLSKHEKFEKHFWLLLDNVTVFYLFLTVLIILYRFGGVLVCPMS